ncbi:glycosyltransferase family 4 protein [Leisingera sp. NJS204]|uniref:glycosyltransferase family 4 protein n=1 Tax=Leisingera sp. NJS204 TaxID=2508307 RepID=UPI001011BC2E|nr:glycosyltransferase family 4 protein [Leisingera sp. NJS204]QAX32122.1 glycosyltransferase [Leisingera sp. NJS204]
MTGGAGNRAGGRTEGKRPATLIVARRLDGARSGSNTYLKVYLQLCRDAGLSTRIVFAPRRSFGNLAWARLDPGIADLADQIDWAQALRIGRTRISLSPAVWLRMARRAAAEGWRRLSGQGGSPYPSLLGVELPPRESEEVMARARRADAEVLTVEYSSLGPLLDQLEARMRVVFLHDLFSLRAENFAAQGLQPDHSVITLAEEAQRCRAADLLIHASCIERDRLRPLLPGARHEWMPPAAQAVRPRAEPGTEPHGLFLGSVHGGNTEALGFLRRHVWPKVRAGLPDAKLWIAGSIAATVSAREAQAEGLVLLGPVDDLAALGGPQAVGLAPMKTGSGIPIKVVDYLSLGMPVAVTPGTLDAFGGALDGFVAVSDSDADYAATVCALLRNDSERENLSMASASAISQLRNPELTGILDSQAGDSICQDV